MNYTYNEAELHAKEAEVRAYEDCINYIDLMMPSEPWTSDKLSKEKKEWAQNTCTLRAIRGDIYNKYTQACRSRDYYKQVVMEDKAKAAAEAQKNINV